MSDNTIPVGIVYEKSESTQVRMQFTNYRNVDMIDIRNWYSTKQDRDSFKPGKGISLDVKYLWNLYRRAKQALEIREYENFTNEERVGLVCKKSESTQVRMQFSIFKNNKSLDIRNWYHTKQDKKFKPGKGINIDSNQIESFVRSLRKAIRIAREQGFDIGKK